MTFYTLLSRTSQSVIIATQRFPLAVLCFALLSVLAVGELVESTLDVYKYMSILACGGLWFASSALFAESRGWKTAGYYALSVPAFCAMAAYLFYMPNKEVLGPTVAFLSAGLFLSIFIAPFLRADARSTYMWEFSHTLTLHMAITCLAALFFQGGSVAIFESIELLFDVDTAALYADLFHQSKYRKNLYRDIMEVLAFLFVPVLTLAGVPRRFDGIATAYPTSYRVIATYVVLPLLLIYAALLHGYILKILLAWELPKGGVAAGVAWFGIIGTIAYLKTQPLHAERGIVRFFGRYFFVLLLAPLVLLAVAIGIRVQQYGITEDRYTVLLCLVWLAVSTVIAFSHYRREASRYILTLACVLLIGASFGPWSAVNISSASQVGRLQALLQHHRLLVNGRITPRDTSDRSLSLEDRAQISELLRYIVRTGKVQHIQPWFAHRRVQGMNSRDIMDIMRLEYIRRHAHAMQEKRSHYPFRIEAKDASRRTMVHVAGYDYFIDAKNRQTKNLNVQTVTAGEGPHALALRTQLIHTGEDGHVLYKVIVTHAHKEEEIVFPLGEWVAQRWDVQRLRASENRKIAIDEATRFITAESESFVVTLMLTRLSGGVDKHSGALAIKRLEASLLLKKKAQ